MKARRFFAFVAGAAMLLGMVGCTDPDEGAGDSVEAAITVEPTTITTTLEGEVKELTVTSNAAWVVSCDQEDVTIEPKTGNSNGVVTVTIPAVTAARNFSIQFKASKPAMMQGIPYTSVAEAAVAVYQNAGGDTSIATNVAEVRALLKALEVTETKSDITDELKAMTLTGIVVAEPNGNMSNDYTINVQDDSTEANSGLTVYSVENAKQLKKGDVVKFSLATAQYQYYKGLLQLVAGASAEVVTEGVEVNPIEVAFADLKNYEAQYVKVNGLTPAKAAAGKAWNSTTGGVNVNFTTADNKTLIVRVNKAASFKNDIVPAKSGALCGVISIFNSDVQLMPQYASDIQLTEDAAGLEAQVVTIAEITQAGTYKVENAWVAGFNGNGPIFTDASGAYINSYIYQHNYKTIGQKVTIEGDVTIRQGGFQFEGPTVTPLEGTAEVVYPENPTVYEGESVVALCEKFLSGAHLAEYAAFKGVLEYDGTFYNLVFAGIDGNKYKGSLSKTPDESLGLDKLNGVPVTLYGFVVDYSGQYVSIVPTGVVENKDAVVLAADAITNVPKEGVTNATHDITVIGIDAVTTEVDGTVVTAASVAGNVLTYSVSANTDKAREGWIKLSAEGVETVTVVVKQESAISSAYNKVTTAPSDWAGVYLFTYLKDSTLQIAGEKYSGENAEKSTFTNITVSNFSGSTINSNEYPEFVIEKVAGTEYYTIKFGEWYVGWESETGNSCQFKKTLPAGSESNYYWIFTLENEVVKINNVGTTERYLQYNASSPRFAIYKLSSNQNNLTLFKK